MQSLVFVRSLLIFTALAGINGCAGEDWGGPKGPRPAAATAATAPLPLPTSSSSSAGGSGSGPTAGDARVMGSASSTPPKNDAPKSEKGDAGGGTVATVEGTLSGGKLPGWEDALAGMRPSLKQCIEGKGEVDAVVELTAKIGAKGEVTNVDKTGGSQFAEGAVPCLVKRLEAAQFKKPLEGSPRLTLRVRLKKD